MATRRHSARVSSSVLSSEASLYRAISLTIGSSLKGQYELPDGTPTYMNILLEELDETEETNPDRAD
jgi:hypothetical protein